MNIVLIFVYLQAAVGFTVHGAKILILCHVPTISHRNVQASVMSALAAKGHNVTILSALPSKEKIPNVRDIYLDKVIDITEAGRKQWGNIVNLNLFEFYYYFNSYASALVESALTSSAMQKLIKEEKFDVIILEPFLNEALVGLRYIFNAHVIVLSPGDSGMINRFSGNVAPYSFVPSQWTSYTDKMTFFERLGNVYTALVCLYFNNFVIFSTQKNIYQKYFPHAPKFEDAANNVSLFLINSNIISESPRPYLPNMIPIGGIHIKEPRKLPKVLEDYLNEAKHGVIVFSLGSNLLSTDLPTEKREAILKTFSKLPQRIIWKFEDENLPGKPDNVLISKWLPITDILAHSNLKLFITHGGMLSTTEAIFRGVPIVGIPFYGDQQGNINRFVKLGYGQQILFKDLTEETFTNVIKEVLYNSSYQINIKRAAAIIKDQWQSPAEKAAFWVEYVIRHNGAQHLRSASLDLSYTQYLLLDIISFIISIIATIIFLIYFVCKKLVYYKCFKNCIADKNKVQKLD